MGAWRMRRWRSAICFVMRLWRCLSWGSRYGLKILDFVDFGDVFDDGQAQARAAHFPGARAVDAVETLEDAIEVGGGDADAVVLDFDRDGLVVVAGGDADYAAVGCVLDGVVDQVADGPL